MADLEQDVAIAIERDAPRDHEPRSHPDDIDRLTPRNRPELPIVMRQRWSHLLFLHWQVPVEVLRPLVPPQLDIDTWEGRAYVGLIPFTISRTRSLGLPAFAPVSDFHETNARTYVHLNGRDPGVWFFSLDAANPLAVAGARAAYKLPYFLARMQMRVLPAPELPAEQIDYRTDRVGPAPLPASCAVTYRPEGSPGPRPVDTLDYFLIERYILYAQSRGRLHYAQVHHHPYPVQGASVLSLQENILAAHGALHPNSDPIVHYSPGVDVEIFPLRRATS